MSKKSIDERSFYKIYVKSRTEILQEKLIEALEKSGKSQDRLAMIEIILAIIAAVLAFIQLIPIITGR